MMREKGTQTPSPSPAPHPLLKIELFFSLTISITFDTIFAPASLRSDS